MNHTSPPPSRRLRRLGTIIGGSVAGVTATLLFAAPALACHPEVGTKGNAVCDETTGEWVVTWTVQNSDKNVVGTVKKVDLTPPGSTVTDIVVGATIPAKPGKLEGVQRVPGDKTSASLGVTVSWKGKPDAQRSGSVKLGGTCKEKEVPPPPASPSPSPEAPESPAPPPSPEAPESPAPSVTPSESSSPSPVTPESPAPSVSVTPVSNDGSLPVTGSSIATAIGISVGLLAIGAGLFYVFRRRRLRFTA